jgi:hypothetical protein
MSLPVLSIPTHNITLPSGKKLKIRPYLAGEQKVLLLALEGKDHETILNAIHDIVSLCTNGKVDSSTLASFDLEYLWLKLRTHSVGKTVVAAVRCENIECKKVNEIVFDLDGFEVVTNENHPKHIKLDDHVGITFKYPTLELAEKLLEIEDVEKESIKILIQLVDNIFDKDQIYKPKDFSEKELEDFFNQITPIQFEAISQFFETMPQVVLKQKHTCPHCKHEKEYVFKGIYDFFR